MSNVLDISKVIKQRIKDYELKVEKSNEGKVLTVQAGIAIISGLKDTKLGEMLLFSNNVYGIALNLEKDVIGSIILGDYSLINEGDSVKRTKKIIEIIVGDDLSGRIIDPLGNPIDGGKKINSKKTRPIEREAHGIMSRESVSTPLETGILSIDSMIPIGNGQRELIIGDRKTGKTTIALDTIINQKDKNVKCVYVSIGQKNSTLSNIVQKLKNLDAMSYTTIVAANASDSDALQYIAPYSGMSIAEEWMENGENVLIVFDDLSKHAVAYRALSLLLKRPPGREAYPGDIFYLHSRLLERSANLNEKFGGGSITSLPIIETQSGDISAYIPTNVISITDGQIFLSSDYFNSGQRPAIDAGTSVSRVGSSAQTKLMKKTSSSLKLQLANYEEIKSFSEFASDLDKETKLILDNGKKIMEILKQPPNSPYSQPIQSILLYLIEKKYIERIYFEDIARFKEELIDTMNTSKDFKKLISNFSLIKDLKPNLEERLVVLLEKFISNFNK